MSNKFNEDAMQTWLFEHHPANSKKIYTPEVMDSFLALTADNNSTLAPSQANIAGPGAAEAKSNTDWATNPALGAINLAQMARVKAGYNPTNLDNAGSTDKQYEEYLKRLIACPLFVIKMSDRVSVDRKTSNWNTVIDAIANTYEGIAGEDKDKIVQGLKNLAQAASSKMKTTQTQAVFVQNTVSVDNVISYYLYSSKTSFYEKSGKGYDTKENKFDIVRLRLEFQSSLWPQWWEKVKNAFDGSVDDWLSDNQTSTSGTDPIPALS